MTFIWYLPTDSAGDSSSTAKAIAGLNKQQELFCILRQMRKDFVSKYRQFIKAPFGVLYHLYKDLVRSNFHSGSIWGEKLANSPVYYSINLIHCVPAN